MVKAISFVRVPAKAFGLYQERDSAKKVGARVGMVALGAIFGAGLSAYVVPGLVVLGLKKHPPMFVGMAKVILAMAITEMFLVGATTANLGDRMNNQESLGLRHSFANGIMWQGAAFFALAAFKGVNPLRYAAGGLALLPVATGYFQSRHLPRPVGT